MLHGHFLLCHHFFDGHAPIVKVTESPEPRTKAISDRKPGTPPEQRTDSLLPGCCLKTAIILRCWQRFSNLRSERPFDDVR